MLCLPELQLQTTFVILTLIAYIIYSLKRRYDYWKDRNVPHVGFFNDSLLTVGKHRGDPFLDLYKKYPNQPYLGYYHNTQPYLLIRDIELVRSILIKDFSHFVNHGHNVFKEDTDPLFAFNLFHLNGQKWRSIRAKLTPIFTSGKLRRMSVLIDACTDSLCKYLDRTLTERNGSVEVRGVLLKFAMDVICVCAFGLDCNAIEDDNSEFRQVTKRWNTPRTLYTLRLMELLEMIHPKLISLFKVRLIDYKSQQFFYDLMRETARHRSENETKRDDFLQLLINLRAEEEKLVTKENQNNKDGVPNSETLFTDDVLTANVWVFFTAGYDTVATTTSYCLYELAMHPEVQEKLFNEILAVQSKNKDQCTYDVQRHMNYMECVINETLRLHPNISNLDRICTKPYQVPGSSFTIKENELINIPLEAIHLDPELWPEPTKFDPERFSEENKSSIAPCSFLPFGDGPRLCIGNRFALMEIKACVARILNKYSVHPTEETEIPITKNPKIFSNVPNRGVHLRFKKREV